MKVRQLDHVNMTVRDFDQTVDWYVRDPTGYEIEVVLWTDDTITFEAQPRGEGPQDS